MQKRIFAAVLAIMTVSVVVFSTLALCISYSVYSTEEQTGLKAAADIVTEFSLSPQEIYVRLEKALNFEVRVTYVSTDGTVLFDSESNTGDNHAEREEIKKAFAEGSAEVVRDSETTGKKYCFYAVRYDNGVLRFGREQSGFLSLFSFVIPIMLVLYAALCIVSLFTAKLLTKQLISPLNSLVKQLDVITAANRESKPSLVPYQELEPLAETIENLRVRLGAYIRKLLETEQIRSDFSANVSHELKTPLTTIKGFAEMMEAGLIKSESDIKKYGGTINRESIRLLSLIDDIIKLSEIEEKKDDNIETISLSATARDVGEMLNDLADKNKVRLSVVADDVLIKGNQIYIYELFFNLAENAIKYNKPGGNVWLRVFKEGTNAVIVVSDTGIGIPEDCLDRIFERFYRVDKSRSKATNGTGLGLSIVKHIVGYHHGEISTKSIVDKGTEITVKLPKNI